MSTHYVIACSRISGGEVQCKVQKQGKNKVFRPHNLTPGTGLSCQIQFISQNLKDASIACHFLHDYRDYLAECCCVFTIWCSTRCIKDVIKLSSNNFAPVQFQITYIKSNSNFNHVSMSALTTSKSLSSAFLRQDAALIPGRRSFKKYGNGLIFTFSEASLKGELSVMEKQQLSVFCVVNCVCASVLVMDTLKAI